MKILILITLLVNFSFACGCTDSSAASIFQNQATQNYDSKDSELSGTIEELNGVLNEVNELVKSDEYLLNASNSTQQVYYDSVVFLLESRQETNAIIQKNITNWKEK